MYATAVLYLYMIPPLTKQKIIAVILIAYSRNSHCLNAIIAVILIAYSRNSYCLRPLKKTLQAFIYAGCSVFAKFLYIICI